MTSRPIDRHDDLPPRELRAKLLDLAGEFVARARVLEGVSRIALLGSIVTAKENPKDIDLLVTVTDECDHDLGTVTISDALIREPPLDLHPDIVIRQAVPDDITEWLATLRPPTA